MKRKTLFFLLGLLFLVPLSLCAERIQVGDLYYNITSDVEPYTVEVTYENPNGTNYSTRTLKTVTIPSRLTYGGITYTVTAIGEDAFTYCRDLTSITIPEGITSIGDDAFYNCSSLTSVIIPEGVTTIGNNALRGCTALTSVTIPESVTTIGKCAFYDCEDIVSITIPKSVTSIGSFAFKGIRNIMYSGSATGSPWGALNRNGCIDGYLIFNNDTKTQLIACDPMAIGKIIIPESVTSIGERAFAQCKKITAIAMPMGVTSIGEKAFYNCSTILSITIPEGVTSIGEMAFYNCSDLTSITIHEGVTSIGERTFYNCSALTSITIPEGVTSIGSSAFDNCSNLTSVTIPESVTSVGNYAFQNCSSLTSVTIPESVTSIGNYTFQSCSSLASVTIPESVTSIGSHAFYNCSALTSVTIPDSVTSIFSEAFYNCSALTSVTIPDSVTSIGENAFYRVLNIRYKGAATGSPWGALSVNGYVEGELVFDSEAKTQVIRCSRAATGEIVIPESVTSIGNNAFYGCSGLTSITIPDGVTSIGSSAFSYCSGLTSITIGNGVTSIGSSAFRDCSGLTSITIPDGVTSIGEKAFYDVLNIQYKGSAIGSPWGARSVNGYIDGYLVYESEAKTQLIMCSTSATGEIILPESVTSIGENAFSGCSGLTSITIPGSVTSFGTNAFADCTSLTRIDYTGTIAKWCTIRFDSPSENPLTKAHNLYINGVNVTKGTLMIPEGVTSIRYAAFYGCTSLTAVSLPESVTSIGTYAFCNCFGLTSIVFPSSLTNLEASALAGCPIKYIVAKRETPIALKSPLAISTSASSVYLVVPENSVELYQAANYWKDYNINTYFFHNVYANTTSTTASIVADYVSLTDDNVRLGYVFENDTIWNKNASETISFTLTGLVPSTTYSFGLLTENQSTAATYSFTTQDISVSLTHGTPTQTTLPITFTYDYGDLENSIDIMGVEYCHGNQFTSNSIRQTMYINATDTTLIDTIITGMTLGTEYTLRPFVELESIGRIYGDTIIINTQDITWEIDVEEITQTTASVRFTYDFGDANVEYISCYHDIMDNGSLRIYIQDPSGVVDTTFTNLCPAKEYNLYSRNIVLTQGESIEKLTNSSICTLPILLSTPDIVEYGQTYAVVNSSYDYGDAPMVHNVLELALSLEEGAEVNTTLNIIGEQTKITDILPDTAYYYRQVLELGVEWEQRRKHLYNFEDPIDNARWHFINDTQTNKWVIGTGTDSNDGSSNTLYISKDGTTYSYANTTSSVWIYCDEVLSGMVSISFDWKGTGQSSYDYMYAYLVPISSAQPSAGSTTMPTGAIRIGSSFCGQSEWTTFTDERRNLTEEYRLYFMWRNNAGYASTPIAIDNVAINMVYETNTLASDWQEFNTKAIVLTTQGADGISNTSALLHGTIDCDQESYTEIGFEWKRSDAPPTYQPQRLLVTDRVDENLLFRLEGLSSDKWYDFRTFCSYLGETYYGEWQSFVTTDKEVLVAPTVQTVGAEISEQGVEMEGFVVAGTEPMLQQGFEVWVKGTTNVLTTVAEGTIMHAYIPEVRSYTTYQYRAYAKTAAGTTYGATLEIETGYIKQNVQDVTVTPSATEATITWTVVEDAAYYLLTLFADEAQTDTIGVYEVGTDGVITRRNKPGAVQSLVNCLVEELEPDTEYFFSVVAYNAADQKVAEETGWFATELPTSLVFTTEEESSASAPHVRKILYRGQVLILRDGKVYNLFGQEVR